MRIFGIKAFLRTISIFGSVFLLRYAIEIIIQSNDLTSQIIYSLGSLIVIVLLFIFTNLLAVGLEKLSREGKASDETKDR